MFGRRSWQRELLVLKYTVGGDILDLRLLRVWLLIARPIPVPAELADKTVSGHESKCQAFASLESSEENPVLPKDQIFLFIYFFRVRGGEDIVCIQNNRSKRVTKP